MALIWKSLHGCNDLTMCAVRRRLRGVFGRRVLRAGDGPRAAHVQVPELRRPRHSGGLAWLAGAVCRRESVPRWVGPRSSDSTAVTVYREKKLTLAAVLAAASVCFHCLHLASSAWENGWRNWSEATIRKLRANSETPKSDSVRNWSALTCPCAWHSKGILTQ